MIGQMKESGGIGLAGKDRLLVVAENGRGEEFATWIRLRYPRLEVRSCTGFVDAIAEICERPAGMIVAVVEGGSTRLEDGLAGVREASGSEARIVLCCAAEWEPVARRAVNYGADGYLLMPFVGTEFDESLGLDEATPTLPSPSKGEGKKDVGSMTRPTICRADLRTESSATLAFGKDGAPVPVEEEFGREWVATLSDEARGRVERLAESVREWKRLALTDECTGLANRRSVLMELKEILGRAEAERFSVTVLVFDVDDFKGYNDAHGHGAGDELLRLIGGLIREHCREQDVVGRYGGDEFVVVFWDAEGPRTAGSKHPQCAMDVLGRFEESLRIRGKDLGKRHGVSLSVSGGLATYPWDARTAEELIERADEALLSAKKAGKNRIFVVGGVETDKAG
ncbi:MAG: GGDEF domain-containing protein [Planctomycetota bacterium]